MRGISRSPLTSSTASNTGIMPHALRQILSNKRKSEIRNRSSSNNKFKGFSHQAWDLNFNNDAKHQGHNVDIEAISGRNTQQSHAAFDETHPTPSRLLLNSRYDENEAHKGGRAKI